jgi:hypothetical protein
VVSVDGLPDQLIYVEKGVVPVLWARPTYLWGKVEVETIVDKVVFNKAVLERIRMDPVRVSRENLGSWSRQLKRAGASPGSRRSTWPSNSRGRRPPFQSPPPVSGSGPRASSTRRSFSVPRGTDTVWAFPHCGQRTSTLAVVSRGSP